MKVLLICEGLHEKCGALHALLEKILERRIVPEYFDDEPPRRLVQGKGGRLFKKAMHYVTEARRRECHGVVFLVDHDAGADAGSRVEQLSRAQSEHLAGYDVKRAFGVPVVTFDAWMIADEHAMSAALGQTVNRTGAPEQISDAKSLARQIAGDKMPLRDFYQAVATHANLNILADRCPKGFAPFAERLRSWTT